MGTMTLSAGSGNEVAASLPAGTLTPAGRLYVPPAYLQTTGDAAVALTSANHKVAFAFTPEVDFAMDALSFYVTAINTTGSVTIDICSDGTALEPTGELNGNLTPCQPTMTANSSPSPYVVGLRDSNGNNSEASGFEAYKAMNGSTAANDGMRSNAAPTSGNPMYFTIDFGAGNAKIINKFRFRNFNSVDTNVQASPKAFTLWASNEATPTVNTDSDWTQITGRSAWTVESLGSYALSSKDYYVSNVTPYRHYRWKITDRNGSNAYVSLGEISLYEAENKPAPGALLQSLGSNAVGSMADTWVRHTFDPWQLYQGVRYWLVFSGAASSNFSLSVRRFNAAAASMFPDTCETKQTADGGTSWAQSSQLETVYRQAMLNVVLQSTPHHCPQLVYGRHNGPEIPLYSGSGWASQTIAQEGVKLDCEALSPATKYDVYLYYNSGTLALYLSTTGRANQDGIEVLSGDATRRFVGICGLLEVQPGYHGPMDLPDVRLVRNRYNKLRKLAMKNPGYVATTYEWVYSANGWSKPFSSDDFTVRLAAFNENLPAIAGVYGNSTSSSYLCVCVDGNIPQHQAGTTGGVGSSVSQQLRVNSLVRVNEGLRTAFLAIRADSSAAAQYFYAFGTPLQSVADIVLYLDC